MFIKEKSNMKQNGLRYIAIYAIALTHLYASDVKDDFTITKDVIRKIEKSFNMSDNKTYNLIEVSLDRLVKECVKRNSTALLQQIQTDIAQKKVKYEEGILDPIFTFGVTKSKSHIPNDVNDYYLQGSNEYKDDALLYKAGVTGQLSTGAKWDLSYDEQDKWSTYIENRYPNENTDKIELTLRQPLLKGFGEDQTLIKINIANLESLIARSEYSKNSMDLIGTVIQLYWKLYGSYKLYLSWRETLEVSQKQLENIEKGFEFGKYSKQDLLNAQASVSLRKLELFHTKTTIFDIQNKILNLLSLSSSLNDKNLLIPTDELKIDEINIPNLDDSFAKSIANWPELALLKEKQNLAEMKKNYAKKQLEPQLDLILSVNNRTLDENPKDARSDMMDRDFVSWSSGVELSIPLNNDYAEQNYEMEKLKHIQSNIELEQISRTLNNGLHSKIEELQNDKFSFYEYINGVNVEKTLLEMEFEKLKLGKSSIVEIFKRQENLIELERKLYNNIIELKLAEASLQKAVGELLVRFNIELYDENKKYELPKDQSYEN